MKKTVLSILMVILVAITMTSCKKEEPAPVVSFEMTTSKGGTPLEVEFKNTTTGDQTEFSWDFGDGKTSTLENPTHTFTSATSKEFTITLTVKGAGGSSNATQSVNVVVKKISKVILNKKLDSSFEYDSKGVLQFRSFYDSDGSVSQEWRFFYSDNQIIEEDYDSYGSLFWDGVWALGSNGQASSITYKYYNNDGTITPGKAIYAYDDGGYMIRRDDYSNNALTSTYTYTIEHGNCTWINQINGDGSTVPIAEIEFDTLVSRGCPDNDFNQIYSFYGKADRNLLKKYTNLLTNTVYTYDYEMDSEGYATKRTVTMTKTDNTTTVTIWEYDYKEF